MSHECPGPGCTRSVGRGKLTCGPCWRKVPVHLQRALYAAWGYGRGAGTPEHREAMQAVIDSLRGEPEPGSRE